MSDAMADATPDETGRDPSPNGAPRKRQLEVDDERRPKLARLTRQNLALLDGMGKKKKPAPAADSTGDPGSSTSKTTSTTKSGFDGLAGRNGILDPFLSKPPANLDEIQKRHAGSRGTASPPESSFRRYADAVQTTASESTTLVKGSRHLLKEYDDGYRQEFRRPFTGFPEDVGFNDGLSAPQPDFVEGLDVSTFAPFSVRDHVDGAVLYKDQRYSPALPHLSGEWKGRGKNMELAALQGGYDGAALVYARNKALSYLGTPDPPGHAEVRTFATDGRSVRFYAHYADEAGGKTEYHQYEYAEANLTKSYQGYKDGRRGIRNAQDHAREQSCDLKDRLKKHWESPPDPGAGYIADGAPGETMPQDETSRETAEGGYDTAGACYGMAGLGYEAAETGQRVGTGHATAEASYATAGAGYGTAGAGYGTWRPADSPAFLPPGKASGGGHKRKSSTSSHAKARQKAKAQTYWTLDDETGLCFHRHSDGRVTWFEESDGDG